jgi:IclR family transcriptional regulator, acetate operon repressor
MAADSESSRGAGARTLELLRCIALGEREFALKDLAEHAGLASSTVHRLLEFWVRRDLIERAGPKAYRLGPALFRLASLIVQKFDLPRIARPFLEALWDEWQETASLCLYEPATKTAMVAASIASPHPLQFVLAPYSEISLAWGSLGRSILAQLSTQEIDLVLARAQRSPLSGRPPPPRRALHKELRIVRERGYALYEDEAMDIAGVSAPVFTTGGAILGCIGVTMPASRFLKPIRAKLPASVLRSARRLGVAVGAG